MDFHIRESDGSMRQPTDADFQRLAINFYWRGTRWMRLKFWAKRLIGVLKCR